MTDTIGRIRSTPAGHDQYGDPVPGIADEQLIYGCSVAPRSSSDITDRGRAGVIVGLTLYAPPGTDLVHTDLIRYEGIVYEVDGEAGNWVNPFTSLGAGIEVALRRAAG